MGNTQIKVSDELKAALDMQKILDSESYEDVIWDLIEDQLPLSDETLKDLKESRKQIKRGEFITQKELRKKLGLSI